MREGVRRVSDGTNRTAVFLSDVRETEMRFLIVGSIVGTLGFM